MNLPTGEFYTERSTPASAPVAAARRAVLRALRQRLPAVLSSLASDVLPRVGAALGQGLNYPPRPDEYAGVFASLQNLSSDDPAFATVVQALRDWSERFGLRERWIYPDAARDTLIQWVLAPALLQECDWVYPRSYSRVEPVQPDERAFAFRHSGWNPSVETRREFERLIRSAFNTRLRNYLTAMERLAVERGFRKMPKSRELEKHAGWAVAYHFQRLSYSAIGREAHAGRKTVEAAVKEVASLAGLRLRPLPPGRPRKDLESRNVAPRSD